MSAPPRTPVSAVRRAGTTINKGGDAPRAKRDTPAKPAGESSSREQERAAISSAWDAVEKAWNDADLGPIAANNADKLGQRLLALAVFAPLARAAGAFRVRSECSTAIAIAKNEKKFGTLVALIKRVAQKIQKGGRR